MTPGVVLHSGYAAPHRGDMRVTRRSSTRLANPSTDLILNLIALEKEEDEDNPDPFFLGGWMGGGGEVPCCGLVLLMLRQS